MGKQIALSVMMLLLASGRAGAEPPASASPAASFTVPSGVRLECLPAEDAAGSWHDWLATRLSLRGLEDGAAPAWRLCFEEDAEQQWVAQPPGWRYDGYWMQPPYRLESWPTLRLTVRTADGAVFWQGRERLGEGDNRRQRLEQAARRLLDRMPLP